MTPLEKRRLDVYTLGMKAYCEDLPYNAVPKELSIVDKDMWRLGWHEAHVTDLDEEDDWYEDE